MTRCVFGCAIRPADLCWGTVQLFSQPVFMPFMMHVVLVEVYILIQMHQNMIQWSRSLADIIAIALVSTEQCWHITAGELAQPHLFQALATNVLFGYMLV